jgi:hypothetical protein
MTGAPQGQGTAGEVAPFRIAAEMEAAQMLDALLSRQEAVAWTCA